jgi:hypothetical protein
MRFGMNSDDSKNMQTTRNASSLENSIVPKDTLACVFVLPDHLRELPQYAEIYDEVTEGLKREASSLPMTTVQKLLLERIAFVYTNIKFLEDTEGFSSASHRQSSYATWKDLIKEFNNVLFSNQDKMMESKILEIERIISGVLSTVADEELRRTLRRKIAEELAAIDL